MPARPEDTAPWVKEIKNHEGCEMAECRNRQELSFEWDTQNDRPNLRICKACATVFSMRLMAALVPPAEPGPPP